MSMVMRRMVLAIAAVGAVMAAVRTTSADYYVEYYRDNLFLGLAYHRIGCMTDWNTIQVNQDYDGFTNNRYCFAGASAVSVPSGSWFDYTYLSPSFSTAAARLNSCGTATNNRYGTPNY